MTKTVNAKTVSIYAAQILLGAIAMAAGAAKLSGTGLLVQQFQMLGIGQVFLTIAGTVEIAAGLCLLLPRGGILGAVLLAGVMIGALGITLGHVASAVAQPVPAASLTATGFQSSQPDGGNLQIVRPRAEWDI
jgi:uncharacterized membrane protein YphA (DoxX/SURF4 family)